MKKTVTKRILNTLAAPLVAVGLLGAPEPAQAGGFEFNFDLGELLEDRFKRAGRTLDDLIEESLEHRNKLIEERQEDEFRRARDFRRSAIRQVEKEQKQGHRLEENEQEHIFDVRQDGQRCFNRNARPKVRREYDSQGNSYVVAVPTVDENCMNGVFVGEHGTRGAFLVQELQEADDTPATQRRTRNQVRDEFLGRASRGQSAAPATPYNQFSGSGAPSWDRR